MLASPPSGLIIAAPSSSSGKTTITLALLRALRERGTRVASIKIGPDFIDPAFHAAASGRVCINLDDWAMSDTTFHGAVLRAGRDADLVVAEGVMGLFDGSGTGRGSTADVAARLGWPVVLVIDVAGMAASAAALARGFIDHRTDVNVAGVVINRLGSAAHRRPIEAAMADAGVPVLGWLGRASDLTLPSRHLGLVQANEHPQLESFIERAARWVGEGVDLEALVGLACSANVPAQASPVTPLPPLGQRIAVARDRAFGFSYPLNIEGWQAQGAEVCVFSPLADETPRGDVDSVFLPGGYPELHAGTLAANFRFLSGMRAAAERGAAIYGECGGFMVLGDALEDADGVHHGMCGLLPVTTSFASPRMTLGYRQLRLAAAGPLGERGQVFRGHEFHFAKTVCSDPTGACLFEANNAAGADLGTIGLRRDLIHGSFAHLIDEHSAVDGA